MGWLHMVTDNFVLGHDGDLRSIFLSDSQHILCLMRTNLTLFCDHQYFQLAVDHWHSNMFRMSNRHATLDISKFHELTVPLVQLCS